MDQTRIAELLGPFLKAPIIDGSRSTTEDAIPPELYRDISTYIDILLRWNSRINLTSVRDPEEIVVRHFGESLFTARHLFAVSSEQNGRFADDRRPSLADIGSGAGFPGIPIKLFARNISLTLIESTHKKGVFLKEVSRALGLADVRVENVRAETLPPAIFDVVTLRAVENFADVLPVAAGLLRIRGKMALLIGESQVSKTESLLPEISWEQSLAIPRSSSRVLLVGTNLGN